MAEGVGGSTDEAGRPTVNILMSNAIGKAMRNRKDILVKNSFSLDSDTMDNRWVVKTICMIAAHVKTPKAANEGLKVLADVMEAMTKQRMVDDITEMVTKDVRKIVGEMRALARHTVDTEHCMAETLAEIQDAAETMKAAKLELTNIFNTPTKMYADATRRNLAPAKVAALIDRQETHTWKVIIQKVDDVELKDYNLALLNKKELVEKANIALKGI